MSSHLTKAKQEKVERDLLKNERALKLRVKALEDNEENLLSIIELRDIEIEELKEDNHFKDDQIENDNNYQDELIKCNKSTCNDCKSLFIWTIAMAGITISALGWAYITWSMR